MIGPYMTDTVTLKQFTGQTNWGEPDTTTDITLKCRIDYKNRLVNDISGGQVVSMARIDIRPRTIIRSGFTTRSTGKIAYEDRITFDGVDHVIISIGKIKDFSTKYMEIYVA